MFLTEEQRSIQQLAQEFARGEVSPQLSLLESGNLDTLRSLWAKLAGTGLTGLPFPEEYGGAGVDMLSYLIALEEIAKVSASLAVTLSVHVSVGTMPIFYAGNEAQKQQYLPDLISGQKIAAFGLTEPGYGSDSGSGITKADKSDQGYLLNGSKIFITNAQIADVFIVTGRTNKEAPGAGGLSAFIIDRGLPGFSVEKGDEKLGLCGSDWGALHFEDCTISADKRLGGEGTGFKLFMKALDAGRVGIGAVSLGLAEACLSASVEYAQQRAQFAKPIAMFQAIQFKLADMATRIEAARQLVYNAARLKDAGQSYSKEASMAKLYASETCNYCAKEAIQIFGGYGYTKDFPVERYFRDAKVMELVEGTSQVQRMIISRHLQQT